MKRKFYETLKEWKSKRADRFALLIDGARRVGKSWIAEEFAKSEYASYLLIDFSKASRGIRTIFEENLGDLDTFFMLLEAETGVRLVRGNALVVFRRASSEDVSDGLRGVPLGDRAGIGHGRRQEVLFRAQATWAGSTPANHGGVSAVSRRGWDASGGFGVRAFARSCRG